MRVYCMLVLYQGPRVPEAINFTSEVSRFLFWTRLPRKMASSTDNGTLWSLSWVPGLKRDRYARERAKISKRLLGSVIEVSCHSSIEFGELIRCC